MSRRLFRIVVALVVALLPVAAMAQTGTITGLVRDSSGAAIPGATVRVVNEATGVAVQAVSNEQGAYRADPLRRGRYRLETALDGFETAVRQLVLDAGQTAAIEVTLTPRDYRGRDRHRPAHRGSGAGGSDSRLGRERRPHRERRRLQREPREGSDSDGAVLFDQSAQLGDQHPRPRRALRAHQRRHRARRRALHRRRLLRPSRRGDARLPRRRADRGPARTAGHALRQEHDRRRHQRHDPQAELHAAGRLRAQLRQPRTSCRPRVGVGTAAVEGCRPAVVLRHPA